MEGYQQSLYNKAERSPEGASRYAPVDIRRNEDVSWLTVAYDLPSRYVQVRMIVNVVYLSIN